MAHVTFEDISVGQSYSRIQLVRMWGYKSHEAISRGVVTPAGHDVIILFVTYEKDSSAEQYEDRIQGGRLFWEGPNDHFAEDRIVESGASLDEIHLFFRRRHHMDFTYLGQIRFDEVRHYTLRPSRFVFSLTEEAAMHAPD